MNSFTTWDIQGTYNGFKNVQLAIGARNMLDTDPHLFIPTANQFQYGYDPAVYDPRGRVVYASIVAFRSDRTTPKTAVSKGAEWPLFSDSLLIR